MRAASLNFLRGTWGYLRKRLAWPFLISSTLFALFSLTFFISLRGNPEIVRQLFEQISQMFDAKEIITEQGISFWRLFGSNLLAELICLAFGCIPFFFLPAFPLLMNAIVFGTVGAMFSFTVNGAATFWGGILPHGVFELPALFLCFAIGFRWCSAVSRLILRKSKLQGLADEMLGGAQVFLLFVLPLTLAAAAAEAYLTPLVMSSIQH